MQLFQRALEVCAILCLLATTAFAADRPNILVIWGDDIGWENVSACGMGVMGYTTPNIDSIGFPSRARNPILSNSSETSSSPIPKPPSFGPMSDSGGSCDR